MPPLHSSCVPLDIQCKAEDALAALLLAGSLTTRGEVGCTVGHLCHISLKFTPKYICSTQ